MFSTEYRKEMDKIMLTQQQKRLIAAAMAAAPARNARRCARALIAAAVVCAMVAATAAAYYMGAFDFLTGRSEYAYLGMNEIYETYAYPVGQSVTAENGDVLTVDRVAMDGTFCTIFYSVRFQEPVATQEELAQLQANSRDSWKFVNLAEPYFLLYAGEEQVSEEGYNNSFEPQAYLGDAHTLYGAWRILLRRPISEGETFTLQAARYGEYEGKRAGRLLWEVEMELEAHPIQSDRFAPGVTFQARSYSQPVQLEVVSLSRSPLGTLLTIRGEESYSNGHRLFDTYGLDFVLRDRDTGAYIPYAEVVTSHQTDPEGYWDNTYELFGDVSGLRNLELIPTQRKGSVSPQKVVSISELPSSDSGNPDGGYAPASYTAQNGQLIVEMEPVGAANGEYARLGNGVYFLDAEGNELFEDTWVEKYKDRSDGTITVVMTPSPESYARDVDKVAQIWFFVQQYDVLEGQAVSIPLS